MLPALLLPAKPNERHSYTRRPEWVRPLESLWSILAKWQFVNRLPYSAIATAILRNVTVDQGVDLRLLVQFRLDALAEHSGVSHGMLASAACSSCTDSRMIEIASQHLRFCATCMAEGFHAVLFQFTPIRHCPIHHVHLLDACISCRQKIPYRLDASFAARPFACPHCAHPLLPDPTALVRQRRSATSHDAIMNWQRFLATYVYWYAEGTHTWRDVAGHYLDRENIPATSSMARRLSFIGSLQKLLDDPPPLPIFTMSEALPFGMTMQNLSGAIMMPPAFSRRHWPRFHTRRFLSLCRRYLRFCDRLQQLNSPRQREVTKWWRKSWEGAISRQCDVNAEFAYPPFGIAEWACYSILPGRFLKRPVIQQRLGLNFEQDLRSTWQAWESVLTHLDTGSRNALHPYLVPPRACWLAAPAFASGSPALGFL